MKTINLTQGKVALVDDEDFEYLNQWKWGAFKNRNTFYAVRNTKNSFGRKTKVMMHHYVLGKPQNQLMTDHIDGNGLNNQRYNLRFVTNRQNNQNRHHVKTSKYPGVHFNKSNNRWQAKIKINGKRKHLGCFCDELSAFYAYRNAVINLGEKLITEETQ